MIERLMTFHPPTIDKIKTGENIRKLRREDVDLNEDMQLEIYQRLCRFKAPVISPKKTGENIRRFRKGHMLTVRQLASALMVYDGTLRHWECGISFPSTDNIVAIAAFFRVPVQDIIGIEDVEDKGSE